MLCRATKSRLTSKSVQKRQGFTVDNEETNPWVGTWLEAPICQSSIATMCKAMLFPYPNEARAMLVRLREGQVHW